MTKRFLVLDFTFDYLNAVCLFLIDRYFCDLQSKQATEVI